MARGRNNLNRDIPADFMDAYSYASDKLPSAIIEENKIPMVNACGVTISAV